MHNILYFLSSAKYIGGAEIELLQIIKNMDHRKFKPFVLFAAEGRAREIFKAEGISTKIISFRHWAKAKRELNIFLSDKNISLVHILTLRLLDLKIAVLVRAVGLPIIWHIHARLDCIYPFLRRQQRNKILGLIYALSRKIVTCSSYAKKQFMEIGLKKKIKIIYNGVRIEAGCESPLRHKNGGCRKKIGVGRGIFLVGMISRLTPQKRPQDFIRAAALVKKRYPQAKFILAGGETSTKFLEGLKKINGQEGYPVIFTGFYDNVPEILNAIDVLVLPSLGESSPLVIAEAMANSKPVVAVRSGGIPELVLNAKTGILVNARSPRAIARAVSKLVNNPGLAARMGRLGYIRAKHFFGIKDTVGRMQELYSGIIK